MSVQLFSFGPKRPPKLALLQATVTRKKRPSLSRSSLRRGALWSVATILSLGAVGLATHLTMQRVMQNTLYDNPRYALKQVVVEARGDALEQAVRQTARHYLGANLLQLDLKALQAQVASLPYVASAQIEKRLPDTLVVRVSERQPMLRLVARHAEFGSPQLFYLDRERVVLKPRTGEVQRPLPELVGLRNAVLEPGQVFDQREVGAAVELLTRMELTPLRTALDIHTIEVIPGLALRMYTQQGAVLTFRLDACAQQLERLQEILEYAQTHDQAVRTVDLTPERNVPVTFAAAASTPAALE